MNFMDTTDVVRADAFGHPLGRLPTPYPTIAMESTGTAINRERSSHTQNWEGVDDSTTACASAVTQAQTRSRETDAGIFDFPSDMLPQAPRKTCNVDIDVSSTQAAAPRSTQPHTLRQPETFHTMQPQTGYPSEYKFRISTERPARQRARRVSTSSIQQVKSVGKKLAHWVKIKKCAVLTRMAHDQIWMKEKKDIWLTSRPTQGQRRARRGSSGAEVDAGSGEIITQEEMWQDLSADGGPEFYRNQTRTWPL